MTSPQDPAPQASSFALVQRLYREHLADQKGRLAVALGAAALAAAMTAALGQLLAPVVQHGLVEARFNRLLPSIGLMLAYALVRGAAQVVQARVTNTVGHRMVGDIQSRLFARLVRADLAQLRTRHSGDYIASVLYDAGLIREAATTGIVNYTQQGLTVIFCLAYMAWLDPYLTLIVLIGAPAVSGVMRRFAKRATRSAKGAMDETSALSTAVMESLDGIKVVKIDNREAFEEARVAAVVERRQRHIIRGANARAAATPATETLTIAIAAAVLLYAGWRAGGHSEAAGRFAGFLGLLMMAAQSLRQVANLQTVFAEGLAAAARLFAALDVRAEIHDAPGARPLKLAAGVVKLSDVAFSYANGVPAVEGVSLEVRRGETVALVGPSGGGKSTILNLIPRFYDVQSGAVTLDGQDVRDVTLASLRDNIALVTQEPFLFDDTIRANIAYARPDSDASRIIDAAVAADAHDFIMSLPDGYDTLAGEAGARLSGGQRQRIAIARAFLKDAPILLLDEATSALDTDSELKVQRALERLMTGRATLLIAHRLSTVRKADRIYVIEDGRVAEQGSHRTLMALGGLYARLAAAQNLDVDPTGAAPAAADG